MMKPTFSIGLPIKNLYVFMALLGTLLYGYSHYFAVEAVHEFNLGRAERGELYVQLNKIEDSAERSTQWGLLRTKDQLYADKLWADFWTFLLMATVSIFLMPYGYGNWYQKKQRIEDEQQLLANKKAKLEIQELEEKQSRKDQSTVRRVIGSIFKRRG